MEEPKKEEDISLNIDKEKLKKFIKKYNVLLLLLIPIFLTIFYRVYIYDLPITKDFATQSVHQSIESQVRSQIIQQAPDIDQESLNALVNQRTEEFIKNNQEQIQETIKQARTLIKGNYQDENGHTYMPDIDSYFYLRQGINVLDHGHSGTTKQDGKIIDEYMLAPNGRTLRPELHPYVIAITHRISTIFGNTSVMASSFIIPVILMVFAIILCFLIIKRFAGPIGATVGSSILAIHPNLIIRTGAGFIDTDAYNAFFPLLIAFLLVESFKLKTPKNKLILASLAGLATGLYAFAWNAWWFFFDVVLATIGIYLAVLIIKYKKNILKEKAFKNTIKNSVIYLVSTSLFVTIFTGLKTLKFALTGPLGGIFLKQAAKPTLWPNVYTTVAELNEIPFNDIISNVGGNLLVVLAFAGPILILLSKKHFTSRLKYSLLIIVWLIAGLYTSTKGIRFILLVLPAYAIGLGILTGFVYQKILKFSEKALKLNKILVGIILIAIIIVSFQPLLTRADAHAKNEVPNIDDTWFTALKYIKDNTDKDAIITSWWDFGHWFKALADRRVTFDGSSQNNPHAHWVGKILLTSNEEEAIAILRMLDCGSNNAYDFLLEETDDRRLTKKVIDEIIMQDKADARETLLKYTDDPDKILEETHCEPPEAIFITSEDMVGKGAVWSHFGSWDFDRALAYNIIKSNSKENAIEMLIAQLNYSEDEASKVYNQLRGIPDSDANAWISGYPGYEGVLPCQNINETIICQNGITIKDGEAKINTNQGELTIALYRDDKSIYKKEGGITDFAVAYIPNKNQIALMHPDLLESMFTELFFYEGKKLKHFELLNHQVGFNEFDIYTWKVKWNSQ